MALTDTKLKNLRPLSKSYQVSDGGGLSIEVLPTGNRVWRLRYRLGGKQEKVTLGRYPAFSLAEAREWREACKTMVARGESPMVAKRQERELEEPASLAAFSERWYVEVVEKTNSRPQNIRRVLEKDVLPLIGEKPLTEVTPTDVLVITDRIKARGSDQVALLTRNVLKRLYAYAIARQKAAFNPAAAIEGKYIARAKARDVALTPAELGRLMRAIYTSDMRWAYKLALHLLILTLVRKSELIEARWEEIDFETATWTIPGERMKKDRAHVVPLSDQARAMFAELKTLSCGSGYVVPSRSSLHRPIAKSTLNAAIRALDADVPDFVIHDFRRSASTALHEAGFPSDVIEKALAHEQRGVRGVYNKAEYIDQRREMLQRWAHVIDAQIDEGRTVVLGRFGNIYRAA